MDKEELIYQIYKDQPIGAKRFRSETKTYFKLDDKTITKIYTKLNNYQIDKYGSRLGNEIEILSKDECERRQNIRRNVKKQRYVKKIIF
jgi:hypothetical protein